MFYGRRRELQRLEAEETAGSTFWTDEFGPEVRVKVRYAIADASSIKAAHMKASGDLLLRDEGWALFPIGEHGATDSFSDFLVYGDDQHMPSALEAAVEGGTAANRTRDSYAVDIVGLMRDFNRILLEHRISFEMVSGKMIAFESRELHQALVKPTLTLLAGSPELAKAEAAYTDALNELASGKPDDAITDAARALQEAFVAVGAEGKALGNLVNSAKRKGLLGPHDHQITDGIGKIVDWVSADRSARGDVHTTTSATLDDAWLSVHVVGAMILRLSKGLR